MTSAWSAGLAPDAAAAGSLPSRRGLRECLALCLAGGLLFAEGFPGSLLGLVHLGASLLIASTPGRPRGLRFLAFSALAVFAAVPLVLEPGALNVFSAWITLGLLALERQGRGFSNLLATALELIARALSGLFLVIIDIIDRRSAPPAVSMAARSSWTRAFNWRAAVLPAGATVLFALILAAANPFIAGLLDGLSPGALLRLYSIASMFAAAALFLLIWPFVRRNDRLRVPDMAVDGEAPSWHRSIFGPGPVAITLVILNGFFVLQNGLDFAFLLTGAELPEGYTYAEYVHRGAFALIVAALAAAALVIAALWPGSPSEASPLVRLLVYAWLAQTILLVVSSVARTLSYVDAYGMTELRLAGLLWMGLVAAGVALVAVRILTRRTNLWLLNANLIAAFALVFAMGFWNTRGAVADYNVSRALSQPYMTLPLDAAYLEELGIAAIPALRRFIAVTADDWTGRVMAEDDVVWALKRLEHERARRQADARTWTLRAALIPPAR